jgi:hypothetical protein
MVSRHGAISKQDSDCVVFGDEKVCWLKVDLRKVLIELRDVALERRMEDAELKVKRIDGRPVVTNTGPLDY